MTHSNRASFKLILNFLYVNRYIPNKQWKLFCDGNHTENNKKYTTDDVIYHSQFFCCAPLVKVEVENITDKARKKQINLLAYAEKLLKAADHLFVSFVSSLDWKMIGC